MHILLLIILVSIGVGIAYHFRAGLIKVFLICIPVTIIATHAFSLTAIHGAIIFFLILVISGFIYLGIRVINSTIRALSDDEEDYRNKRNSFVGFAIKWFLIYIAFGFLLETFLSIFIEKNEAFLVKMVYGSRIFLGILFIFFLVKVNKNRT